MYQQESTYTNSNNIEFRLLLFWLLVGWFPAYQTLLGHTTPISGFSQSLLWFQINNNYLKYIWGNKKVCWVICFVAR